MKFARLLALPVFALLILFVVPVQASNHDPLLISMTSDDAHRSKMAIGFGLNQLKRGHPLVIFFNDHGVKVVDKRNSDKFTEQQNMVKAIIDNGGVVYACPTCSAHFKVNQENLVEGVGFSNPDLMEKALFKDNLKTLTW